MNQAEQDLQAFLDELAEIAANLPEDKPPAE